MHNNSLGAAFVAMIAGVLLLEYNKLGQLQIKIKSFNIGWKSLITDPEHLPVKLSIIVVNPSSVTATVQTIKIDVFIGGNPIGTISKTDAVVIKPNASTTTDVLTYVNVTGIYQMLYPLYLKVLIGNPLPEVRLRGFIDSNLGRLQIDQIVKI